MRKAIIILAVCALLVPGLAAAAEFEGSVIAPGVELVTMPYGGTVQSVSVREGETIQPGDTIARMQTRKVYAQEDGVVRGIFAETGDALDEENAVLYIATGSAYEISCSTASAYDSQETRYIRLGETVYVVYRTNQNYHAVGIVTAVSGSSYTVQTQSGNLTLGKTVYMYRDEAYSNKQLLGKGKVERLAEMPVYGTGSLLKLYVENGETVTRGQLLFETVAGDMLITAGEDGAIRADSAGIVESVSVAAGDTVDKDAVILTVVPPGQFEIGFTISEDMLESVFVGQSVNITFSWNEDTGSTVPGTVTKISYVSETSDDTGDTAATVEYMGYVSFEADDTVKLGMSVTVDTVD
ncbi:MAG: HlyD family efflux transporter periplasmic adaptor subunit [Firmicutes bacterium]|nr:HlyD family efflux transporter periplasmic adaptor subunit [Bacillota bacterium]